MQHAILRDSFVSLQTNADFSEALVLLADSSRLGFRHTVEGRWVKALRANAKDEPSQADTVLAQIKMFRLNAKHLDVQFIDGSRWEHSFRVKT